MGHIHCLPFTLGLLCCWIIQEYKCTLTSKGEKLDLALVSSNNNNFSIKVLNQSPTSVKQTNVIKSLAQTSLTTEKANSVKNSIHSTQLKNKSMVSKFNKKLLKNSADSMIQETEVPSSQNVKKKVIPGVVKYVDNFITKLLKPKKSKTTQTNPKTKSKHSTTKKAKGKSFHKEAEHNVPNSHMTMQAPSPILLSQGQHNDLASKIENISMQSTVNSLRIDLSQAQNMAGVLKIKPQKVDERPPTHRKKIYEMFAEPENTQYTATTLAGIQEHLKDPILNTTPQTNSRETTLLNKKSTETKVDQSTCTTQLNEQAQAFNFEISSPDNNFHKDANNNVPNIPMKMQVPTVVPLSQKQHNDLASELENASTQSTFNSLSIDMSQVQNKAGMQISKIKPQKVDKISPTHREKIYEMFTEPANTQYTATTLAGIQEHLKDPILNTTPQTNSRETTLLNTKSTKTKVDRSTCTTQLNEQDQAFNFKLSSPDNNFHKDANNNVPNIPMKMQVPTVVPLSQKQHNDLASELENASTQSTFNSLSIDMSQVQNKAGMQISKIKPQKVDKISPTHREKIYEMFTEPANTQYTATTLADIQEHLKDPILNTTPQTNSRETTLLNTKSTKTKVDQSTCTTQLNEQAQAFNFELGSPDKNFYKDANNNVPNIPMKMQVPTVVPLSQKQHNDLASELENSSTQSTFNSLSIDMSQVQNMAGMQISKIKPQKVDKISPTHREKIYEMFAEPANTQYTATTLAGIQEHLKDPIVNMTQGTNSRATTLFNTQSMETKVEQTTFNSHSNEQAFQSTDSKTTNQQTVPVDKTNESTITLDTQTSGYTLNFEEVSTLNIQMSSEITLVTETSPFKVNPTVAPITSTVTSASPSVNKTDYIYMISQDYMTSKLPLSQTFTDYKITNQQTVDRSDVSISNHNKQKPVVDLNSDDVSMSNTQKISELTLGIPFTVKPTIKPSTSIVTSLYNVNKKKTEQTSDRTTVIFDTQTPGFVLNSVEVSIPNKQINSKHAVNILTSPVTVTPEVATSTSTVTPAVAPSTSTVTSAIAPSTPRVIPAVSPSTTTVTPAIARSTPIVNPAFAPSASIVTPVVAPSTSTVMPAVAPSTSAITPGVVLKTSTITSAVAQSTSIVNPALAPSASIVTPVVAPSTSTVIPAVAPSTSTVTSVVAPSTSIVNPALAPSASTVTPVVSPSTSTVIPEFVPSTSTVTSVVALRKSTSTPAVAPSKSTSTPAVVLSTFAITPGAVPKTSTVTAGFAQSTSIVNPAFAPSASTVTPVVAPSTSTVIPVIAPSTSTIKLVVVPSKSTDIPELEPSTSTVNVLVATSTSTATPTVAQSTSTVTPVYPLDNTAEMTHTISQGYDVTSNLLPSQTFADSKTTNSHTVGIYHDSTSNHNKKIPEFNLTSDEVSTSSTQMSYELTSESGSTSTVTPAFELGKPTVMPAIAPSTSTVNVLVATSTSTATPTVAQSTSTVTPVYPLVKTAEMTHTISQGYDMTSNLLPSQTFADSKTTNPQTVGISHDSTSNLNKKIPDFILTSDEVSTSSTQMSYELTSESGSTSTVTPVTPLIYITDDIHRISQFDTISNQPTSQTFTDHKTRNQQTVPVNKTDKPAKILDTRSSGYTFNSEEVSTPNIQMSSELILETLTSPLTVKKTSELSSRTLIPPSPLDYKTDNTQTMSQLDLTSILPTSQASTVSKIIKPQTVDRSDDSTSNVNKQIPEYNFTSKEASTSSTEMGFKLTLGKVTSPFTETPTVTPSTFTADASSIFTITQTVAPSTFSVTPASLSVYSTEKIHTVNQEHITSNLPSSKQYSDYKTTIQQTVERSEDSNLSFNKHISEYDLTSDEASLSSTQMSSKFTVETVKSPFMVTPTVVPSTTTVTPASPSVYATDNILPISQEHMISVLPSSKILSENKTTNQQIFDKTDVSRTPGFVLPSDGTSPSSTQISSKFTVETVTSSFTVTPTVSPSTSTVTPASPPVYTTDNILPISQEHMTSNFRSSQTITDYKITNTQPSDKIDDSTVILNAQTSGFVLNCEEVSSTNIESSELTLETITNPFTLTSTLAPSTSTVTLATPSVYKTENIHIISQGYDLNSNLTSSQTFIDSKTTNQQTVDRSGDSTSNLNKQITEFGLTSVQDSTSNMQMNSELNLETVTTVEPSISVVTPASLSVFTTDDTHTISQGHDMTSKLPSNEQFSDNETIQQTLDETGKSPVILHAQTPGLVLNSEEVSTPNIQISSELVLETVTNPFTVITTSAPSTSTVATASHSVYTTDNVYKTSQEFDITSNLPTSQTFADYKTTNPYTVDRSDDSTSNLNKEMSEFYLTSNEVSTPNTKISFDISEIVSMQFPAVSTASSSDYATDRIHTPIQGSDMSSTLISNQPLVEYITGNHQTSYWNGVSTIPNGVPKHKFIQSSDRVSTPNNELSSEHSSEMVIHPFTVLPTTPLVYPTAVQGNEIATELPLSQTSNNYKKTNSQIFFTTDEPLRFSNLQSSDFDITSATFNLQTRSELTSEIPTGSFRETPTPSPEYSTNRIHPTIPENNIISEIPPSLASNDYKSTSPQTSHKSGESTIMPNTQTPVFVAGSEEDLTTNTQFNTEPEIISRPLLTTVSDETLNLDISQGTLLTSPALTPSKTTNHHALYKVDESTIIPNSHTSEFFTMSEEAPTQETNVSFELLPEITSPFETIPSSAYPSFQQFTTQGENSIQSFQTLPSPKAHENEMSTVIPSIQLPKHSVTEETKVTSKPDMNSTTNSVSLPNQIVGSTLNCSGELSSVYTQKPTSTALASAELPTPNIKVISEIPPENLSSFKATLTSSPFNSFNGKLTQPVTQKTHTTGSLHLDSTSSSYFTTNLSILSSNTPEVPSKSTTINSKPGYWNLPETSTDGTLENNINIAHASTVPSTSAHFLLSSEYFKNLEKVTDRNKNTNLYFPPENDVSSHFGATSTLPVRHSSVVETTSAVLLDIPHSITMTQAPEIIAAVDLASNFEETSSTKESLSSKVTSTVTMKNTSDKPISFRDEETTKQPSEEYKTINQYPDDKLAGDIFQDSLNSSTIPVNLTVPKTTTSAYLNQELQEAPTANLDFNSNSITAENMVPMFDLTSSNIQTKTTEISLHAMIQETKRPFKHSVTQGHVEYKTSNLITNPENHLTDSSTNTTGNNRTQSFQDSSTLHDANHPTTSVPIFQGINTENIQATKDSLSYEQSHPSNNTALLDSVVALLQNLNKIETAANNIIGNEATSNGQKEGYQGQELENLPDTSNSGNNQFGSPTYNNLGSVFSQEQTINDWSQINRKSNNSDTFGSEENYHKHPNIGQSSGENLDRPSWGKPPDPLNLPYVYNHPTNGVLGSKDSQQGNLQAAAFSNQANLPAAYNSVSTNPDAILSAHQLNPANPLPPPPTQNQIPGGIANGLQEGMPLGAPPEFQDLDAILSQDNPLSSNNWGSSLVLGNPESYQNQLAVPGQMNEQHSENSSSGAAGGHPNSFVPYVYSKVVAGQMGMSYSQNGQVAISETLESQSVYNSESLNQDFMISPICIMNYPGIKYFKPKDKKMLAIVAQCSNPAT